MMNNINDMYLRNKNKSSREFHKLDAFGISTTNVQICVCPLKVMKISYRQVN